MRDFLLLMSLISQKDREMVIESLEYYILKLKEDNCTPASIYTFNTLLKWIELEHYKNEDKSMVLSRNESVEVDSV
jgi:hypothetical protein